MLSSQEGTSEQGLRPKWVTLPSAMSLRLGRDRPAQLLPGSSKVELGVQALEGVLLLMLRAYPCGPHHCMLMPGHTGVLGLWLQGLERQMH